MIDLQYTPYIIPLISVTVISVVLALIVWPRRPGPGITPFLVLTMALAEWSLASVLELSSVDLQDKIFFSNLQYIGITGVPGAWLAFTLEYTGRERWLSRRRVALLLIEPALTLLVAFTNPSHGLFRARVTLDTTGSFNTFSSVFGPAFWAHGVYSYSLIIAGSYLLFQALLRSPRLYRSQILMLLLSSFAPWIANAVFIFGFSPPNLDLTPFAFTITVLAMGWSVYRYRFMDIVPVARETVIESMSDALLVLDRQNRIVDINPAGLHLLRQSSPSEVIGRMAGELLIGVPDLVEQYRTVMEANTEIAIPDGEKERYFSLKISPLLNCYGELTGRLIVLHEITALRLASEQIQAQNEALMATNRELAVAREEAEEANRLKSEFLATMSHELRTPLNSVIGYADLMLTGLVGEFTEKQQDYLRRVVSNGERLLSLINDILDISKIEAGRFELACQPFEVADLVQNIEKRMQTLAEQKGICLGIHLDPLLPPSLVGDQKRLEQILTNLVGNAIKFTDQGCVDVYLSKLNDEQWAMAVSDTGRGIPPHALEFIFDEFRQVDGSSQREHGGSGLGLAIVRKLVTLMNGTVQVQSELGKGSMFKVQLPLIVPEMLVAEAQE